MNEPMAGTYAVIGDPIDHSLSPNIHNAAFRELNMDCSYMAYKVPRDELDAGVESLKKVGIAGFNVTIPHKMSIMEYLDMADENCKIIGAANTVAVSDGIMKGYNTDMDGFLDPIKRKNLQTRDSNILLLGAGGAARAIVAAFAGEKAGKITIANRTVEKAVRLAKFADSLGVSANVVELKDAKAGSYDFVVNSTAVGLKDEPSPVSADAISAESTVYDIVYSPMSTRLIKDARKKGAEIIYGYEMLLGQASRAFEIWHKRPAPYETMKRAILGVSV